MSEMPEDDEAARGGRERRQYELCVDWSCGEHFLFSYITNISEMGIFIRSDNPLPVGTSLELRFAPDGQTPIELLGDVTWINAYRPFGDNLNPGMGVRFRELGPEMRERIVELVRTVAYLRGEGT